MKGEFTKITGKLELDQSEIPKSHVEAFIDATTLKYARTRSRYSP